MGADILKIIRNSTCKSSNKQK